MHLKKMKAVLLFTAVLGVCAGCFLYIAFFIHDDKKSDAAIDRNHHQKTYTGESIEGSNNKDEEIRRLRAQIKQKDRLLFSMMQKTVSSPRSPNTTDAPRSPKERTAQALQTLDQRVAAGNPHSPNARLLKEEIETAIDRGLLGTTALASLICGQELCRLALTNDNRQALNESTLTFVQQMGKTFEGISAFEVDDGQKRLYVAKTRGALEITWPDEAAVLETVTNTRETEATAPPPFNH